jgi:hypothetical protein
VFVAMALIVTVPSTFVATETIMHHCAQVLAAGQTLLSSMVRGFWGDHAEQHQMGWYIHLLRLINQHHWDVCWGVVDDFSSNPCAC